MTPFISIDQNCSPLWDAIPKLAALHHHGHHGLHCIEDLDIAFTQHAAPPGTPPHLAPETIYPDGNSDWGASLFYSDFLGRNPINPRTLEPILHAPAAVLAKRAGLTLPQLFAAHASSDNHQIIAPSFLSPDTPHRHRTLADLTLAELRPALLDLLNHAYADTLTAFPSPDSQTRTRAFFDAELAFLNDHLRDPSATLTRLHRAWLNRHTPHTPVQLASTHFADAPPTLLTAFLTNYTTLTTLYNQALADTHSPLTPLDPANGDLPFFALCQTPGPHPRHYRTPLLLRGNALIADNQTFSLENGLPPLDQMRAAGITALPPKALLLVLLARTTQPRHALALPWQGSLYMPAARRLQTLLEPLLHLNPAPVLRVRFHFLDHLATLDTPIRLPDWLAPLFPSQTLPANTFPPLLRQRQQNAAQTLATLTADPDAITPFIDSLNPGRANQINHLQTQRLRLSADPSTRTRAIPLWQQQKQLQQLHFHHALTHLLTLLHLQALDYWDSRGALLPHALALGGPAFYTRLLAHVTITPE